MSNIVLVPSARQEVIGQVTGKNPGTFLVDASSLSLEFCFYYGVCLPHFNLVEPSEMSGPEVVKTPGGGAPGKEGKEPIANGHPGEGEQGGDDPFAEYMWMENEDVYNRQVEEELLEQEFLERCFQEMLDEEDQDWFIPARDLPSGVGQIQQQLNGLSVSDGGNAEEMARKSNLNPDAKEFVPGVKY
ncbi:hypothetical protein J4Q44_G00375340 [Coregonus suidteri]|uniref:Ataxin-2 C-terminal domain-containing protein n=1 Tax=Coregonus suidteri TaxID=861788 RepID=A0AAN8KLD4_9TELE